MRKSDSSYGDHQSLGSKNRYYLLFIFCFWSKRPCYDEKNWYFVNWYVKYPRYGCAGNLFRNFDKLFLNPASAPGGDDTEVGMNFETNKRDFLD